MTKAAKASRPVPEASAEIPTRTRRGRGQRSELLDAVVAWIADRKGSFTVADLPAALRVDVARTAKLLANLKQKGRVRKGVGRGCYLGALPGAPVPTPPASAASRRPMTPTGSMVFANGRRGQQIAAIEVIALRMGPATQWSANEMEAWVGRDHPHLVDTPARCSDLRVRLIDMAGDGLLLREGVGAQARYRLGRLANRNVPETANEAPLRISVPRDSDAGG